MVTKPTVVSTFAGCGGSSLGYQMAGFDELLAVEWDDNAVETFKLNFPGVPVFHGDIHDLTAEKCCKLAGIKAGELDVLDGSPPCQGFSTAGKREFSDPRNSLAMEFVRLIDGLRPRVFVMENVTGLVKGVMKQTYLTIVQAMRDCGYRVKGQILNAMYYGVPQSRERVIVVGVRNDLGIEPSHPKPEGKPITIREAWKGVKNTKGDVVDAEIREDYATAKVAKDIPPGGSPRGKFFNLVRAAWDRPCPTVAKSHGSAPSMAGLMHPTDMRRPTIPELKRIGSYPDGFLFAGSFGDTWARIGNSVPPLLMKAIAGHIRENILEATHV